MTDKFVRHGMLIYQGFRPMTDKFVRQKVVDQYLITSRPPLPPKGLENLYQSHFSVCRTNIIYPFS